MEFISLFSPEFRALTSNAVSQVFLEKNNIFEGNGNESFLIPNSDALTCSYCRTEFESIKSQRAHYKSDWHIYNLNRHLISRPPASHAEYASLSPALSESSSSSESSPTDPLSAHIAAKGRLFLQAPSGPVLSLSTCLLYPKKEPIDDPTLNSRLAAVSREGAQWALLMIGGGHFAAAIYHNGALKHHKTFHFYTVRAGQGGAQAAKDARSAGAGPKSAGASLRRQGELRLAQSVRELLDSWRAELGACALVFYRAAGPRNRAVLFGAGLERSDPRLRSVPFSTRRAGLLEIERIFAILSQAALFPTIEAAISAVNAEIGAKKPRKPRDKSRDRQPARQINAQIDTSSSSDESFINEEDFNLIPQLERLPLMDLLQEFHNSLEERGEAVAKIKGALKKRKRTRKTKTRKAREAEDGRKAEIVDAIVRGDLDAIRKLFEAKTNDEYGEILDDDGNTALHMAAMNEHTSLVEYLLENGADPCRKNGKNFPAYACTKSKEVREGFRHFARLFPERYNYKQAQIPVNAATPEELAEKRRALRKVKKEKEKAKKAEKVVLKQEQDDKDRFLRLSDREKRALAAEKRILDQKGQVVVRCFLCASDMAGKVPFEYLGNRFCTIDCLKAHRIQHAVVLS